MEIKCKGESDLSVFSGMSTLFILGGLGVGLMSILTPASLLIGMGLIAFVLFILSRIIKSVSFGEKITVKYFFGRFRMIDYSQCKKMYRAYNGEIYEPINVLKYNRNGKEKKITFVCEDSELEKICNEYFNGFKPKFR